MKLSEVLDALMEGKPITRAAWEQKYMYYDKDEDVFVYFSSLIQLIDDLNIICIRSFQMNFMLKRLLYHKTKMRTLGTITIMIFPFVIVFLECLLEQVFGLVDLGANFREIGKF